MVGLCAQMVTVRAENMRCERYYDIEQNTNYQDAHNGNKIELR